MGLIKSKALHIKGNNQQNPRRQPTGWENKFANDMFDKKLISEIYKELIQLKIKKENPIKNRQKI